MKPLEMEKSAEQKRAGRKIVCEGNSFEKENLFSTTTTKKGKFFQSHARGQFFSTLLIILSNLQEKSDEALLDAASK
jgi:hypothetical protein